VFKSIQHKIITSHITQIIIIDDDFVEDITKLPSYIVIDAGFFIKFYESKSLNVPANLVLYFKYISSKYQSISVQNQIDWNYKYNSSYKPYAIEIEKYFLLL
jgi:hypothetical protein